MRPLRLLCVGGDPADAFDSAGGTLAHHVERGDHVSVMALTQGTRIHDVVISDTLRFRDRMPEPEVLASLMAERARVKEDEVRRACAFLGISDVHFFRYDDSAVTITAELIDRIARFIRENRPDVVITHHPHELGGFGIHHATTAQLVLEGIVGRGSRRRRRPQSAASGRPGLLHTRGAPVPGRQARESRRTGARRRRRHHGCRGAQGPCARRTPQPAVRR